MSSQQIIFNAYADSGEAAVLMFDAQPAQFAYQIAELLQGMSGTRLPSGSRAMTVATNRVAVYIPPQPDFEPWLRNIAMELLNASGIRPLRGFMNRGDYLTVLGHFGL